MSKNIHFKLPSWTYTQRISLPIPFIKFTEIRLFLLSFSDWFWTEQNSVNWFQINLKMVNVESDFSWFLSIIRNRFPSVYLVTPLQHKDCYRCEHLDTVIFYIIIFYTHILIDDSLTCYFNEGRVKFYFRKNISIEILFRKYIFPRPSLK